MRAVEEALALRMELTLGRDGWASAVGRISEANPPYALFLLRHVISGASASTNPNHFAHPDYACYYVATLIAPPHHAATTLMRAAARERGFARMTISMS
jgi:hypothetical protein